MIRLPLTPTYASFEQVTGKNVSAHIQSYSFRAYYRYCAAITAGIIFLALTISSTSSDTSAALASKASRVGAGLQAKVFGITIPPEAKHDAEYFIKNGISPASWTNTFNPPSCVHDYVSRNGLLSKKEPLKDWETRFPKTSGCPVYPIPEGGLIFHMHWEGPWASDFDLAIDSFLATQRLKDGHRLIFWHGETTPPPPAVVAHYAEIAPQYVEFRVLDRLAESSGTCLDNMPEWTDANYRASKNMKAPSLSNLTRLLLLSKYGGIWIDSDAMFIRDLTDLLRVGPFAPSHRPFRSDIHNTYDFFNNHVINVGPAPSRAADKLLETACGLGYGSSNWPSKYTFQPHMGRVFNDGLLQICMHHAHCGLSAFPLAMVESETWTPDPVLKPCHLGTPPEHVDAVLKRTWIWHFRNSCDHKPTDGMTGVEQARRKVDAIMERNMRFGEGMTLPGA